MLNFSKKSAFGLDLSDLSFKIVQLQKQGQKVFLKSFINESIPAGIIKEGEIIKEKELIAILQNILKKAKVESLQGKRVVCNLPEEKVFIRVIQLPKMKKEELAQAVYHETEANIPMALSEVYLDWQVIKPMVNSIDHIDVLVAVCPRTLSDSCFGFLRRSGLEPIALEPESAAAVRSLGVLNETRPTIIVDIGASGTNFVVFSALAIRFTSHVHISGNLFNQIIMKELGVSEKEANQMKIKAGLDRTKLKGKIYDVLSPIINDLVKQIKDYMAFYHSHSEHVHGSDRAIGQILLCGGDSLLLGLPDFLSQRLDLSVELGNPLINVSQKQKKTNSSNIINLSKKESVVYAIAIGLALGAIK